VELQAYAVGGLGIHVEHANQTALAGDVLAHREPQSQTRRRSRPLRDSPRRSSQWNGSLNRSELEVQFLEAPEQKSAVPFEPTIACRTVLGL
jgi:hypothetical protein